MLQFSVLCTAAAVSGVISDMSETRGWYDENNTCAREALPLLRNGSGLPGLCESRWAGLGPYFRNTTVLILGGQGGSGSRLAASFVIGAPVVQWGDWDVLTHDSLPMRRSGLNVMRPLLSTTHSADYSGRVEESDSDRMARLAARWADLVCCQLPSVMDPKGINSNQGAEVLRLLSRRQGRILAFKEPLVMFYLPFVQRIFGDRFRFIHVTRDVRTIKTFHHEGTPMMRKFLRWPVGMPRDNITDPEDPGGRWFARVWGKTQAQLMSFVDRELRPNGQYLQMKYEDLTSPEQHIPLTRRVKDFLGLTDAEAARMLARLRQSARPGTKTTDFKCACGSRVHCKCKEKPFFFPQKPPECCDQPGLELTAKTLKRLGY